MGRGGFAATGPGATIEISRRSRGALPTTSNWLGWAAPPSSTNLLGHPEKRKWPEQFDTHEVYNSKVDALTHQINDVMPLYVSFRRALHGHTTVWYEPLEEENIGHGGCHEVTGGRV